MIAKSGYLIIISALANTKIINCNKQKVNKNTKSIQLTTLANFVKSQES